MLKTELRVCGIPAMLYGEASDDVWLFVHGKSGCKEEGEAFAAVAAEKSCQVLAIDLPEHGERKAETGFAPWYAVPELQGVMAYLRSRWRLVYLRANSIGAWFSLLAFADDPPEKALLVSPILDMEGLIRVMMLGVGADEARLEREGEIPTPFGETLSWRYLQYVREHPLNAWSAPTAILYAGGDNITPRAVAEGFAAAHNCVLTVYEPGEHWFHAPPQLAALESWERENV